MPTNGNSNVRTFFYKNRTKTKKNHFTFMESVLLLLHMAVVDFLFVVVQNAILPLVNYIIIDALCEALMKDEFSRLNELLLSRENYFQNAIKAVTFNTCCFDVFEHSINTNLKFCSCQRINFIISLLDGTRCLAKIKKTFY